MDILRENRVFLKRNGKILLFKHHDAYDGDDVNIEEYLKKKFLRYIAIKKIKGGIKIIYFYFVNATDQYLTQYGEWLPIEELRKRPLRPATEAVLKNYHLEGQFDDEIRVGVRSGDDTLFTVVTE